MKGSITIDLEKDTYIEVHYNCWREVASLHYDNPPDPSGHEVELIELHTPKSVIDITSIADEISSALSYDQLEETVTEHILNN